MYEYKMVEYPAGYEFLDLAMSRQAEEGWHAYLVDGTRYFFMKPKPARFRPRFQTAGW